MTPTELQRLKELCDVRLDWGDGCHDRLGLDAAEWVEQARTALPALIAEVERLEAENEGLRETLHEWEQSAMERNQ